MRIIKPARKARTKNQDGSKHLSPDSRSESGDFLTSSSSLQSSSLDSSSLDSSGSNPIDNFADLVLIGSSKTKSSESESEQVDTVNISTAKKEINELMAKGMRLLAMREHSIKELNDKLAVKALSKEAVTAVLDELIENNYVSDERFAESYVRSRANRGFGPIKIRAELKNKGISNRLIAEYLDIDSAIWLDNARNQYHKKYGDDAVSDYNTWTKRARFMQSRGFTAEHIQVSLPALDL